MHISLDVVIPSYRLDEKYLKPILNLSAPLEATVTFYLVCDNPNIAPSQELLSCVDNRRVFLLINEENKGASYTRNKGFLTGSSEWILFLDDDITIEKKLLQKYIDIIRQKPQEIGFFGIVNLPPPMTNFSEALLISGNFNIFQAAKERSNFIWGATANVVLNRHAIGELRFSDDFPKAGGGEDVDFFFHFSRQNDNRLLLAAPNAIVTHPWWNEGRPQFKRSIRYGIGSSLLILRHAKYTYRDSLNAVEISAVLFLLSLVLAFFNITYSKITLCLILCCWTTEFLANVLYIWKKKKNRNIIVAFYVFILKMFNDSGLLYANILKGNIGNIGKRFDFSGETRVGSRFFHFNTYKIIVWILYLLLVSFLITICNSATSQ